MNQGALNYINISYFTQSTLLCPGGKKSSSVLFLQTVTIVDSKATSNIFFRRDTEGLTSHADSCVNSLIPCCNLFGYGRFLQK